MSFIQLPAFFDCLFDNLRPILIWKERLKNNCFGMPLLGKRLNWKQQSKYAALINSAFYEKLTAVRFCDRLRDGKADSAASGFARAGRIGAVKALKDIG